MTPVVATAENPRRKRFLNEVGAGGGNTKRDPLSPPSGFSCNRGGLEPPPLVLQESVTNLVTRLNREAVTSVTRKRKYLIYMVFCFCNTYLKGAVFRGLLQGKNSRNKSRNTF